MKRRLFTLLLSLVLLSVIAVAQEKIITGTVTDTQNQPQPGISVQAKGSSVISQTNDEGIYRIPVPQGVTVLIFSGVGFATQEVIITSDNINVTLTGESKQLGEIVVTALGISRQKKALGYAVQEVKGAELDTRPTNALSAISGKVAGLQVTSAGGNIGGSSRILLRGIRSISGNNQPLFVIDGTPIDNADLSTVTAASGSAGKDFGNMIQDLNPDDIESFSVLKGPSASALYGSRAGNGVILITTKKGKLNKPVEVTVNTGIELESITRLPRRQKTYGGGFKTTFTKVIIEGTEYNIPEYEVDESWGPKLDGTPVLHWYNLDPEYPELYLKTEPWSYPDNDINSFFKTGFANTNNISISGGNQNSTYRLSFTNKNVNGTVPNSSLNRNTVNFSGSTKAGKFSFFNNFTYIKNNATGRPWSGATNRGIMLEAFQWGQVQVDYEKLKNYQRPDGTQILWNRSGWQNTPSGKAARFIDNPYWSAYKSYMQENRDRFFGNIGTTYEVNDWLKLTARVNADYYNFQFQDRIAVYSRSQSMYQEYNNTFSEFNYELIASASKTWNRVSLNANVGGNIMDRNWRISDAVTQGGLIIPEYYNLKNASTVLNQSNKYHKRINSVFASASLGWNNLVYLDGTIRNDWSSTLPAGNNSFLYPSVSGSFVLSQLDAVQNISWLDFAKIRLGWAQVGNDTDPYQLLNVYEPQQAFAGLPGYQVSATLKNKQLKPEISTSYEAGINLMVFNNRLGLDVTYYNTRSRNQILNTPVSSAFGYTSKIINAGLITNKGIEIVLNGTPIRNKNFEWNASANWSRNRNQVVKLIDGVSTYQLTNTLVSLVAREGQPYGQLLGYDFVYAPDGQKVVQANGTYARTQQMVPLGSVLPDFLWGFQNRFHYKDFDLSILIDGRAGGKFFSQTYKVSMYAGVHPSTVENNIRETGAALEGVKGEVTYHADGTYEVKNTSPNDVVISAQAWGRDKYNGPTSQVIFDADFIKLREVNVGYTLRTESTVVKSLRFSIYGRNLWNIYTVSKDIDPEFTNSGGNIQGIEGGNIPVPLTLGFNVNVRF